MKCDHFSRAHPLQRGFCYNKVWYSGVNYLSNVSDTNLHLLCFSILFFAFLLFFSLFCIFFVFLPLLTAALCSPSMRPSSRL